MQEYGPVFARVYELRWRGFAERIAPAILEFAATNAGTGPGRRLLDLCCGTGRLARFFLQAGYEVVGLDRSPSMLERARANNAREVSQGRAVFLQGDAEDFSIPGEFGLVVSTFDALNHLPSIESLGRCFRCVERALATGGSFVFDLNNRRSFAEQWNGISVEDGEELMLLNRGFYSPELHKAYAKISGFLRREDGLYERFDELLYNTEFPMAEVSRELTGAGFRDVVFTKSDFRTRAPDPEEEPRAYVVAGK